MNPKGYKHTDEAKLNMKMSHVGKAPLEHAFKKGFTPWNKGKPMSEETKKKLSIAHKGKPAPNKGKPAPWTSERNKTDNRKRARENHWNWKGGIAKIDKILRRMPEYIKWRLEVFMRDNWTCQVCGARGYVTAHHIKGFSQIIKEHELKNTVEASKCDELWNINNGVTLCEECHKLTDNYKGRAKQQN